MNKVSKFIHSKPSGFNDTIASTKTSTFMRHNSLASVIFLTQTQVSYSASGVRAAYASDQPYHIMSTKGPVTHHVARPHPPAQRPNSDHSQEQTTLKISNAASVCRLHYWPRPHCSLATLPRFALQLDAPVLVVFRKCSHSSK